jgi:hypothetical protein
MTSWDFHDHDYIGLVIELLEEIAPIIDYLQTDMNMSFYSGETHLGKPHNDGAFYENRVELSGNWWNGKLRGPGVFKYEKTPDSRLSFHKIDSIIYDGRWKNGRFNGHGDLFVSMNWSKQEPFSRSEDTKHFYMRVSGLWSNGLPRNKIAIEFVEDTDDDGLLGYVEGVCDVTEDNISLRIREFRDGLYERERIYDMSHWENWPSGMS